MFNKPVVHMGGFCSQGRESAGVCVQLVFGSMCCWCLACVTAFTGCGGAAADSRSSNCVHGWPGILSAGLAHSTVYVLTAGSSAWSDGRC